MSLVLKLIYNELQKADENFHRDPRTSHLPLLGSPWPMAFILICYLLLVRKWGPKFMENRPPYNVKRPMQIYNAVQVLLNLYVFCDSLRLSYLQPHFSFSCQEYNVHDARPAIMALRNPGFVYYISKYLDLLDTVFFVLRKKNNQVTFLHVYHHTIMVVAVWTYVTLLFASHYTVTGVINSFIHVCMYSYYLAAASKVNINLTPWKRRLTQLQILQFCFLVYHLSMPLLNNWCGIDLFWTWMAFLQNVFMLLLFSDFYYKTYILKSRKSKQNGSLPAVEQKLHAS